MPEKSQIKEESFSLLIALNVAVSDQLVLRSQVSDEAKHYGGEHKLD